MPTRDDDFDRLHPREFPEPDDEGDDELAQCPHCHAVIYEHSERCAVCGTYLSVEDAPANRPWWVVVGLVVCLAMAFAWAIWG